MFKLQSLKDKIASSIPGIKQFIKEHWKFFLLLLIVLTTIAIAYYEYKHYKPVPMATVSQLNAAEIAKAMAQLNIQGNPQKLTETIIQREKLPPDIVYITQTQKQADTQANKLAKDDKADALIKQTNSDNGQIVNKYYGVHTEKNNKIKAGITILDSQIYENIAYHHKKDELTIHMQLDKAQPVKGATYMRTVLEW